MKMTLDNWSRLVITSLMGSITLRLALQHQPAHYVFGFLTLALVARVIFGYVEGK